MSAPKPHLAQSAEPLKNGAAVVALCGAEIRNPIFRFWWDTASLGKEFYSGLRFGLMCRKCIVAPEPEQRYVYGVQEGQEAIDQGCES